MTMKVQKILMVVLFLVAFRAKAAVTITPASPTAQDSITAVIDVSGGCGDVVTTSVTGNSIRTDIVQQGCILGPPPFIVQETVRFGPLAPGTYTYDVYINYEHTGAVLDSSHLIVVAPAIPAIAGVGLSILAILLAGAACFALGKHG
jgi:hypothetical protein